MNSYFRSKFHAILTLLSPVVLVVSALLPAMAVVPAAGQEAASPASPAIGSPVMIKDINGNGSLSIWYDTYMIGVGNKLFLVADDDQHGYELWKSDGSAAGTVMVKDINPAYDASGLAYAFTPWFTQVDGLLYFVANDGAHGVELWKSDGSGAGTVMVADIYPGAPNSSPHGLIAFDGKLYFFADDGVHGVELWKSDGTATGTVMVKEIYTYNELGVGPGLLTVYQDALYFSATENGYDYSLYKTDGTSAGTELVKNPLPGYSHDIRDMAVSGANLYFIAWLGGYGNNHGFTVWKSNGTTQGTTMIKNPDPDGQVGRNMDNLTDVKGVLFFAAYDAAHGVELWKSDGTESGTAMVKDIIPDTAQSFPDHLVAMNGVLYFDAIDATHGRELWKSDGTAAGTVLVKDIDPGASPGLDVDYEFRGLRAVGNTLYFTAQDSRGQEPWISDGTTSGTQQLGDINRGGNNSRPAGYVAAGNWLYFAATDGTHGRELWGVQLRGGSAVYLPLLMTQ